MQRTVIVKGPKGTLSYGPLNFCKAPVAVVFTAHTTDAVAFTWDFNDGATVNNTDSFISHQYSNAGLFMPKIMLVDNAGCRVPVQGLDTIKFTGLTAQFQRADTNTCNDGHVLFTNTTLSADSIVNYHWNFGDGSFAENITNPVHDYPSQGMYYPSLTVRTLSGCTDSFRTAVCKEQLL